MIETKEKEIDGSVYRVTQLGSKAARRVFLRLSKLIVPALAQSIKGTENIPAILESLVQHLSDDDVDFVCEALASVTKVVDIGTNSKGDKFDSVNNLDKCFEEQFRGKTLQQFQWLAWAIEVNFADFLAESGLKSAMINGAANLMNSASKSPPKSTGGSGESPPVKKFVQEV